MNYRRLFLTIIYATGAFVLNSGCSKGGGNFSVMPTGDTFIQTNANFTNELDILFVVNAEPSMSSFQTALVNSMATFMNTFETKGFEYKIAVVTSSGYMADPTLNGYDPVNEDAADYNDFNGTVHSGFPVLYPNNVDIYANFAINAKPTKNPAGQDGRSFSSFRQALQSTRPINAGFLRSKSFLAVIIVDNQDDFSGNDRCAKCNTSGRYTAPTLEPVANYVSFLDQVTGTTGTGRRYNVSAMTQSAAPCQGGSQAVRIMELAQNTGGILGDICQPDFGPSMASISSQIAMLSTQFRLDRIPNPASISVKVDGAVIPEDSINGWTYDGTANSIYFHGDATPQQGAVIDVNYDPISLGQ
jgi:hypothetical protein